SGALFPAGRYPCTAAEELRSAILSSPALLRGEHGDRRRWVAAEVRCMPGSGVGEEEELELGRGGEGAGGGVGPSPRAGRCDRGEDVLLEDPIQTAANPAFARRAR